MGETRFLAASFWVTLRRDNTDDPCAPDRSPEAAVVGLAAVVAEHEVLTGRDHDGLREVAVRSASALVDVRVRLACAVADHVAVDDRDAVAGKARTSSACGRITCQRRAASARTRSSSSQTSSVARASTRPPTASG